jgi:NAD-dependent DNA ligase
MTEAVFAAFAVGAVFGFVLGSEGGNDEPADSVAGLLEDRREALREDYREGRISHDRFASEIELLEDPRTEDVMYAVTDVDGIGPATALEIAREYRTKADLVEADVDDLRRVNGVGENRARAMRSRMEAVEREVAP